MKRRNLLVGIAACALPLGATAQEKGWQARLVSGDKQGDAFLYGLHIILQPGWKTYWQDPGDAGIAPSIDIEGKNISTIHTSFPAPLHFTDASGTSIGYHDAVVIGFAIETTDKLPPAELNLKAFMGMCNEICVPAKISLTSVDVIEDQQLITTWRDMLPKETEFVTEAKLKGDKLKLLFNQKIDDVFLVGIDWIGQSIIKGNEAEFTLAEQNAASIRKNPYVIANVGGKGLQQMVTLQIQE